jgi:protein phosphatase
LHADLESLHFILRRSEFLERVERELIWMLFLGDYADRGEQATETYYLLLSLKRAFPERVLLLRGNHEFLQLPVWPHDLPLRLRDKFGEKGTKAYHALRVLFDALCHAAIASEKYLFLHGGLPVELRSIDELAFAHQTYPQKKHLEEILWSDPGNVVGSLPSPRGAGRIFGADVTKRILRLLKVKLLVRSHEPCDGVALSHEGMVLTIFSRKGSPYFNERAAYLEIDLAEVKEGYELGENAVKF